MEALDKDSVPHRGAPVATQKWYLLGEKGGAGVLESGMRLQQAQVLRSAAGYYVGFFCPRCGPYSRESGYYASFDEAQEALDSGLYFR